MGETYVEVATNSLRTAGAIAVIVTAIILTGVYFKRQQKRGQRPIAMMGFACGIGAIQFLPFPKDILLARVVPLVCVAALGVMSWQTSTAKSFFKRFGDSTTLGILVPVLITLSLSTSSKSIQVTDTEIVHDGKIYSGLPISHCVVEIGEKEATISSTLGADITISNDDLYQNSEGQYLHGKVVAQQIENWVATSHNRKAVN